MNMSIFQTPLWNQSDLATKSEAMFLRCYSNTTIKTIYKEV